MKTPYMLITGSSSGIGREMAIYLSKVNHIILHGRDYERLQNVKSQCDINFDHKIWAQDLNEINDIERSLSQFILKENIEISGYVHCAGYMKMVPLKMSTAQILTSTLNTNIISASLITKILIYNKYYLLLHYATIHEIIYCTRPCRRRLSLVRGRICLPRLHYLVRQVLRHCRRVLV